MAIKLILVTKLIIALRLSKYIIYFTCILLFIKYDDTNLIKLN